MAMANTVDMPLVSIEPLRSQPGLFDAPRGDLEVMALYIVGCPFKDIAIFTRNKATVVEDIIDGYDPERQMPQLIELKLALIVDQASMLTVALMGQVMKKLRKAEHVNKMTAGELMNAAKKAFEIAVTMKRLGLLAPPKKGDADPAGEALDRLGG